MRLDRDTLRDLIDERLPRGQVRAIQSGYKDPDRFDDYVAILQERVEWDNTIVLPFGEHLYVASNGDGSYIIKCDCGHEFCAYDQNWKLEALINERRTDDDLREIYPKMMSGDADWNSLREYFCPGCKTLLEVEAVPPGYPVIHDFVPDLDGFYREWLGRELPA